MQRPPPKTRQTKIEEMTEPKDNEWWIVYSSMTKSPYGRCIAQKRSDGDWLTHNLISGTQGWVEPSKITPILRVIAPYDDMSPEYKELTKDIPMSEMEKHN